MRFPMLDVDGRERKSWVVWYEHMRFPDVIIELLSESTRAIDYGEKKDLYERTFHTPEYYLYDPYSQEFTAYHLHAGRYREIAPDAQRTVYSPNTDLRLGVRDRWLRWLTIDCHVLPTPMEQVFLERQRVAQERQRAEQAEHALETYRQRFGMLEGNGERTE
jgi:hypothetical protein